MLKTKLGVYNLGLVLQLEPKLQLERETTA